MEAVVKYEQGPGNVQLMHMSDPTPNADQVLLEVAGCGICGTDLHVYHDTFKNYPPVILGHEFYGKVIDLGRGVSQIDTDAWYSILGAVAKVCGNCSYCYKGEFMYCQSRRGMGHGVHGAFAPYAVARPDQLFKLPEGVGHEQAALVEPLAAAVHAVCEVASPNLGDLALVSGPGPIGLLIVKLLARQGIRVIVAGTSMDTIRLEQALKYGAAEVVDINFENLTQTIEKCSNGNGVDLAFEVAGAKDSVNNCLAALRPLGTYVQVGHFGKPIGLEWDHVAFKQLLIKGSLGYTRDTWIRTIDILEHGEIHAEEIITHRLPLREWKSGFDLMERKEAVKILLQP